MPKPKKTKRTVAEKSVAYANAFPPHPHQQEFIDACVALRADNLAGEAEGPVSGANALTMARAEFDAALNAVLYPPSERRFYIMWKSSPQARALVHYTQTVWSSAAGKYGDQQPMHYEAKSKVQN